ncbi:MAG: UvrD-helicase domain-containing protein [Candidatus Omnitrophica bacterium]|nr:ATP-dependent DNA helicase PcrA [bacterium]MCK6497095.1 UvrD-helicase domain-containing protein [bacterium]MCL4735935.1 UvrD-helicase domain-containing protein [Candidatus Omnitrophota bacterium]NUP91291.1 UvrD-helicase domain-containing protein [Candidatus Omnitrophota bacterium]
MDLSALNPEQREAVEHRGSPLLILAGAGSGKTRVITMRIAHLLATGAALPENILAVTFTNRAAMEMRERVASLVSEKSARALTVSTFHSCCAQILRKEIEVLGYSRKFTIYDASDQRTLLTRVFSEFSHGKETFDIGTFAYRISRSKNKGLDPDTYEPFYFDKYDDRISHVWKSYQEALKARDALDFDDLLLLTHQLLKNHPGVLEKLRKQFTQVLIDEYQDTNHLQFEIARLLCEKHRNLCVVGDDDQSIYGFRGAEVSNILEFEQRFPDARIITLSRNYRSTENILKAANAVINRNINRRQKELWSKLGEGQPIEMVTAEDENDEARFIALAIQRIKAEKKLSWSDFGVLYRSNIQSRPFEIIFRQNRIPYVVIGGMEFFDRKEVKDIASYLRVLSNPKDDISLRRIINVPRRGIGDTSLQRLNDAAVKNRRPLYDILKDSSSLNLPDATQAGIHQFLSLIDHTQKVIRQENLSRGVLALIHKSGYLEDLEQTSPSQAAFEMRKEITLEMVNTAEAYERETQSPSLWGFLQNASLDSDYKNNNKDKKFEQETVRLMTLHSAKGLEFPVVFLAGLEEGLLPHARSMSLDTDVLEERRLFYVGMTRARQQLFLTMTDMRTVRGRSKTTTESRFIGEIPPEFIRYTETHLPEKKINE